ncbi:MAG: hypothetical protein Q9165_006344 [Trypethelium subeluteriae]
MPTKKHEQGLIESFYVSAQEACRKAIDRLGQLNLQDDELKLLKDPPKPADVVARLEQIVTRLEKQNRQSILARRSEKFFNSFCGFADKISSIAVVTKKEREDSLLAHIENIGAQLPLMEFYKSVFPTNQMKECVVRVYICIMKMLDDAVAYYRSGRLGKLVDAIFQAEGKFDVHVKNIGSQVQKMHALKDAGHIAQNADMMKIISSTGQVVVRIYENFECQANAIGTSLEIFEMARYSRELQDLITLGGQDNAEDPDAYMNWDYRLSQKDHWDNNGILEDLREWSREGRERLLWVGGCSGNQDSWVTELSADMINALRPQSMTLLYAFCEQQSNAVLTPTGLIRRLLVQLLELHPEIPYTHTEIWSIRRVKNAVSFTQLWNIFQRTTERLSNVFIIIDRIEECEATDEADVVNDLLPTLIQWAATKPNVDVVVTSVSEPPVQTVLELRHVKILGNVPDTRTIDAHDGIASGNGYRAQL